MAQLLLVVGVCCSCAQFSRTESAQSDASGLQEVGIESSLDGQLQPALVYIPEPAASKAPLLVLLHTWSSDYRQQSGGLPEALEFCQREGWALAHPNFRGPNRTPQACASQLAVQDVLDAVEFMQSVCLVDQDRVYLLGLSGGGHMALSLTAHSPRLWAGVSAWVPISDLARWHQECSTSSNPGYQRYAQELNLVCGGEPGHSAQVDAQYFRRSPLHRLSAAAGVPVAHQSQRRPATRWAAVHRHHARHDGEDVLHRAGLR